LLFVAISAIVILVLEAIRFKPAAAALAVVTATTIAAMIPSFSLLLSLLSQTFKRGPLLLVRYGCEGSEEEIS
jgi:hypothetical protein